MQLYQQSPFCDLINVLINLITTTSLEFGYCYLEFTPERSLYARHKESQETLS